MLNFEHVWHIIRINAPSLKYSGNNNKISHMNVFLNFPLLIKDEDSPIAREDDNFKSIARIG